MNDGKVGRTDGADVAMNVNNGNDGQTNCGRAIGGLVDGIQFGNWGCGVGKGHHSTKVAQTVTTTVIITPSARLMSSRTVASTSLLATPSGLPSSKGIPSVASSIISAFSTATNTLASPSISVISSSVGSAPAISSVITSSLPKSAPSAIPIAVSVSFSVTPSLSKPTASASPIAVSAFTTSLPLISTTFFSTTPSSLSSQSQTPIFATALSITVSYPDPSSLTPFFPKATDGSQNQAPKSNPRPEEDNQDSGLGPESASGIKSSQAGGIIAGILLGVLIIAFVLVFFLFRRYRIRREHRRSIGSFSLNGDNDRTPILGLWRRNSTASIRPQNNPYRTSGSGSLRTKDRLSKFGTGYGTNGNQRTPGRRDTAPPGTAFTNYPPDFNSDFHPGRIGLGLRPITLPAPAPAFAPLRANRSSSVYSGSLLDVFSSYGTTERDGGRPPEIPTRNWRRGMSLNLGASEEYTGDVLRRTDMKRSASEPHQSYTRNSWRKQNLPPTNSYDGSERDGDQFPATLEDFQRMRNMGEGMRRGRPLSEGEKTIGTTYTVLQPNFEEKDLPKMPPLVTRGSEGSEESGGSGASGVSGECIVVRVYKEPSWGDYGSPGYTTTPRAVRRKDNVRDSGDSYSVPSPASSGRSFSTRGEDEETGLVHIALRGGDGRGSVMASSRGLPTSIRPSLGTGYGGFTYALPGPYGNELGNVKGKGGVRVRERVVDVEVDNDEMSVFSGADGERERERERERLEELRRGYKGKIRFGMGVQRRLSRESLWRAQGNGMGAGQMV